MRGAVRTSRDDPAVPGARTPGRLLEVDPGLPLRRLVEDLARWLPWPDGTACWVATVREPGDRWAWTEWTAAVVHRDRVVLRERAGTVRQEIGATGWQAGLHVGHRSTGDPPATDDELLAVRRDSRRDPELRAVEVVRDDVHAGDGVDLARTLQVGEHLPVRTLLGQLSDWVPWPQRSQGWVVRVTGPGRWAGHVVGVLGPDRIALHLEGVTAGALLDALGPGAGLHLAHRSSSAPPATDAELLAG